jgi:hypothetical protein
MQGYYSRPCHSNIATPRASGLVNERAVGAKFLLVVVVAAVAPAVPVPVPVPLMGAVADEMKDDEGDGLGHRLLYTNWSGWPLQAVVAPASYVPFG